MTRKITIGFYGIVTGTSLPPPPMDSDPYSDKLGEIIVLSDDPAATMTFLGGYVHGMIEVRVDKDEPA